MNFKRFHESKNLFPFDDKNFVITAGNSNLTVKCENGNLYLQGTAGEIGSLQVAWKNNFAFELEAGTYYCNSPSPLGSNFGRYIKKYDDNTTILTGTNYTFTLSEKTKCYLSFYIYQKTIDSKIELMLNSGSTPQPYESYGNTWRDIPHYIHNTSTDTITTLPAVLYPTGTTATVGLKGNMSQSGTPTPTTPIQPQECGEGTGNLLPEFYATSGEIGGNSYTITKNSIETHNDGSVLGSYYVLAEFRRSGNYANYAIIDEKHSFKIPAGTYTFSGNENIHSAYNGLRLIVGQLGQTMSAGAINVGVGQTFTINADSYVCPVLEIRSDSHVDEYTLTNPMLNLGSAALPYEPYGYKIPILNNSQTTNVYLGEVQSTRRIKKLVLKGSVDENITLYTVATGNLYRIELPALRILGQFDGNGICTHYRPVAKAADRVNGTISGGNSAAVQGFVDIVDDYESVDAFKAYLAQQYAAGTPVCVWYVLATPTTGIINEPIRKIGDYADTVSGITIPTIAGKDTFDVLTTLKPSEVSLAYTGWHDASVKEWDGSQWQ